MADLDFDRDVTIEPESLDTEWLDQAPRMLRYAKHSAEQQKNVDLLKDAIKVIKAQVGKDVRANPESYGLTKVTEGGIEEVILLDKIYQRAAKELIEAQYEAEVAHAAVEAFRHRKSALENLVQLFMSQYFAGPKIPRDLSKEWEDKQRQQSANQTVRIERTKRTK